MVDRSMVYNIIYALAAKDGREKALFGDSAPHAITAFEHSLAGSGFPELWFEIPLTGEPWFDLHVLTESKDVEPGMAFSPETCGGNPKVFEWFAAQEGAVRQLAQLDTSRATARIRARPPGDMRLSCCRWAP